MAKLLQILAASVGGGLVLGAGIRLGEAIVAAAEEQGPQREDEPEWRTAIAGVTEKMARQQDEMAAMRRDVSRAAQAFDSAQGMTEDARGDLRRQIGEDIDRRIAAVEEGLHRSLEAANRQTASAMVESIEKRLAPRIERLESEISGQSASVAELRDCAMQSERTILRLLTALERSMAGKVREQDGAGAAEDGKSESPRLSMVR